MAKYSFTKKAVEDLTEIWNYSVAQWSEVKADDYYRLLIENCSSIAENSEIGKSYDRIRPNLRGLKVKRHIIFYRKINSEAVEIVRILHGKMDLRSRLS